MNPVAGGVLFASALWTWHLPALYQAALADDLVHGFEHLSFLGAALIFWALVIGPERPRRLDYGPAMLLVFVTGLQSAALAVILIFASQALYPIHRETVQAWSLSPLQDQQLAGAVMWTPAGIVFLITVLVLLGRWLKAMNARRPADTGERS
jgi:putative membrane protein